MSQKKKPKPKRYVVILIHILCWIFLFSVPRWILHRPAATVNPVQEYTAWISLIFFFYANYFYLVPRLLTQRKFILYACSILVILLFTFASNLYLERQPGMEDERFVHAQPAPPPEIRAQMHERFAIEYSLGSTVFVFLILAVSTSLAVTEQWYHDEKKRKENETQRLSAELALLRSQINPHFFFNTLNSIYSLASKKSDLTTEAILKLSALMRYIIYDSMKEMVPLQKELDYISNFVELQKLRLHKNVSVVYTIDGIVNDKWIEPMLLLPFVENAFKHGIDYSKPCRITIRIVVIGMKLQMNVENPLVEVNQNTPQEISGIGLINTTKRLDLLYPGKYTLLIDKADKQEKGEDKFRVWLSLNLKENDPSRQTKSYQA